MIQVTGVNEPTFSAAIFVDVGDIVIRFEGNADMVAQKHLDRLFSDVHDQAQRLHVGRVQVDLRDLTFMSSSCIKELIVWLEKVRRTEQASRYLVAFLSNDAQPWQRRSLHALSHFAHGIVSVDAC
jgi:hypothetical protein